MVDPDTVARAEFSHAFRGYDANEVQVFLLSVADQMRALREALDAAEERAERAAAEAAGVSSTAVVGGEAARVLQAAEDAAAEIRSRAEDAVAKMLRDAQDEVSADRSRAQQERADVVAAAERDADQLRQTATAELERGREEGRAMVEEAREVRERVLANLSEKRQVARRELTQLRAGIDELRSAYGNIEALLAASIGELDRAVPAARTAALRAGEQVSLEPEPYVAPETCARLEHEPDPQATAEPEGPSTEPEAVPVEENTVEENTVEENTVEENTVGEDGPEETVVEDTAAEDPGSDDDGTIIDLESRRATIDERSEYEAHVDLDAHDDAEGPDPRDPDVADDELDPELVSGDAIDERRQAERRQLFLDRSVGEGETVLEFAPLLDAFGPADDPVPLVPQREAGDIDELFARIRESRAGAVAQAREVLHRTAEIPIIDPNAEPPTTNDGALNDHLVERDKALDELAPEAALLLKRVLADHLNEVLDVLRRMPEGVAEVGQLIPESADRTFGEVLRERLSDAASRGAGGGTTDVGPVLRAVGNEVGNSLRSRIAGHLHEPDQLERRIRSVYREWRRDKAEGVVADAVAAAYGLGLLGSLAEGTPVRWVAPPEGCCGADCHDNTLATDVIAGEPFPTGDVMAPARPGCRGLVVPADQ